MYLNIMNLGTFLTELDLLSLQRSFRFPMTQVDRFSGILQVMALVLYQAFLGPNERDFPEASSIREVHRGRTGLPASGQGGFWGG